MAKRLLEFENELIDLRDIKQVTRGFKYSKKEQTMIYSLEINTKYPEGKIPYPTFDFHYITEKLRDEKYELFKMLISDFEDVEILP